MQGVIHGIISREQAERQWLPHDERIPLHGTLGERIQDFEAAAIFKGADEATQDALLAETTPKSRAAVEPALRIAHAVITGKADGKLIVLLRESNDRQLAFAQRQREIHTETSVAYAHRLCKAMAGADINLFGGYKWLPERLFGAGQPAVDYVPMSFLEHSHALQIIDGLAPSPEDDIYPTTDLGKGIILAPVGMSQLEIARARTAKPHEWIHAAILGVEMYDITDNAGIRGPQCTMNGVFTYEPTTATQLSEDDDASEGYELSEAYTEHVTRSLVATDPALGPQIPNGGYDYWAEELGKIQYTHPKTYKALGYAAMTDATPNNPHLKRELIAAMYATAGKEIGTDVNLCLENFGIKITASPLLSGT